MLCYFGYEGELWPFKDRLAVRIAHGVEVYICVHVLFVMIVKVVLTSLYEVS